MQHPDHDSGSIMSICFTICSPVSLLLLVFKYRSSGHAGTTRIVSTSHTPLCTRLIFLNSYLHLFRLPAPPFGTFYDHIFFSGSYVRFLFGFSLSLAFLFHLVKVHIKTNRHAMPFPFLAHLFRIAFCRLLTLALLQGLSLYTHRPSFEPDPLHLLMVQYNIAILGGPLVAHINLVVFFGCAKPHSIGGVIRSTSVDTGG